MGNAWTALLAWLQVRSQGGTMVLRVEDLDPERSKLEYIECLIADLKWLGLDWDEGPDAGGPCGPYRQDARRELYRQAVTRLKEQGLLYPCYCSRAEIRGLSQAPNGDEPGLEYPGACRGLSVVEQKQRELEGRQPAWRVKVPDREIAFFDLCKGKVAQNLAHQVGDFAVVRTDGVHAYQLAVVVDDGLMHISHVLRGDDLLFSTPRQIWLYHKLGLTVPVFAHVPLLCGWDGVRLSKRHGSTTIAGLRRKGVKAEAVNGYLGHLAGLLAQPEPVTAGELLAEFSLDKLPREPLSLPEDLLAAFQL